MSFLDLARRTFLVVGLGNRRSIAYAIGRTLQEEGARVIYSVRHGERAESVQSLVGEAPVVTCDLRDAGQIEQLAREVGAQYGPLDGFVHSVANANYSDGVVPFHETRRDDFLDAMQVSAFSLVELAKHLKPLLRPAASVVAMGISSYVAAPTYGYLSPIKAALENCVRFLAKSFSSDTAVRFNIVNAGPLKTRASAGIPGFLENYLYAEKMTPRDHALTTQEVANAAVFLLSPRASGINGQSLTVNAGMDWNYFDEDLVAAVTRAPKGSGESPAR